MSVTPRRRYRIRLWLGDLLWRALWGVVAVGLSYVIGGFTAAIIEGAGNPAAAAGDRDGGVTGVALVVLCGVPVAWRVWSQRRTGLRRGWSPVWDGRLSKLRMPPLLVALLAFGFMVLATALSPTASTATDTDSVSGLAVKISLVSLGVLGMIACVRALLRRRGAPSPE